MGVTAFEWGPRVQLEANKCWFYSLTASILLSIVQLLWYNLQTIGSVRHEREKKGQGKGKFKADSAEKHRAIDQSRIYQQLVIDCCDLTLPGSAIGWSPSALASPLVVGIASTISTTVSGRQIWRRVQQSALQP